MSLDPFVLYVASVTFFIGGLAKGVLGFGLPMIAIPILTAVGSLPLALSIAAPPAIATNLWQFWKFRAHRQVPFLKSFLATAVLGLLAGTFILKSIENAYLEIMLGCFVLVYVLRPNRNHAALSPGRQTKLAPIAGSLTGLVHGSMGLAGLIAPPFFLAAGLSRPAFIFATSAIFIVMAALHMPTLAIAGLYEPFALVTGLIVILPAFAGVWVGGVLGDRVKASAFPTLVKGMLSIAAILPIWGGLAFIITSSR